MMLIFTAGTIGYHLIEGMSFFDGFYMTFITITTIGFSEVSRLSNEGRILTIVLSLFGIGVIAYIASQTTQILFESEIFRRRAIQKQLEKIEDHYIICGYGRIGHRIATVLANANMPLVIVENRPEAIKRINNDDHLYIEGNAQEEEVLQEAGIKRAKGLVCTLSRDQDNVFVTLIARELKNDLFILVRTNQHKNTRKILRAGADKVISPYEIGADRMANVILRPHVDHFVDRILGGTMNDHIFDEIKVFEGSELAQKTIAEAEIRPKYFVVIIAVIPNDGKDIVFNPAGSYTIQPKDTLIVLGDVERIEHMRVHGCDDHRSLSERAQHHKWLASQGFDRLKPPHKSQTTNH
ncbi:MAG: potassium channel family protein [Bacteroidota bacterium]